MNRKEKRPSILIVDDERGTREVLAKFLRANYDVTLAEPTSGCPEPAVSPFSKKL